MTLQEVYRMKEFLSGIVENQCSKDSVAAMAEHLDAIQLDLETKNNITTVQVVAMSGMKLPVKCFDLSENLCVVGEEFKPFRSFRSKSVLTHKGTGMKVATLIASKKDAIDLAKQIEAMVDLRFVDKDDMRKDGRTQEQWSAVRDAIIPFQTQ